MTEDITIPTTWASGNIYVIDTQDIYVRSKLTIQPGAIVKFGGGRRLETTGTGQIEAVGTAGNSIVFTSLRDDLHGGDTNKDQASTAPDTGDWSRVSLGTASGSKFEYCEFYYGGSLGVMLDLGASMNSVVRDCTFAFSSGIALSLSEVDNVNMARNTFYYNETPIVARVISLRRLNVFHNPLDERLNTYQGIFQIPGQQRITGHVIWSETEVPLSLPIWDFSLQNRSTNPEARYDSEIR